jgi:hypothetical protein
LHDRSVRRVERALGRADEQTQNQGGQCRDRASNHFDGVLGIIAQMMLGQQSLQQQAQQCPAENARGAD